MLFFGITFVIVGGVYLLHIQDGLCRLLEAQFDECDVATGHAIEDAQVIQSNSHPKMSDDFVFRSYVKFPMAFRSIKSISQSYLSIAGWYLLALTLLGVMGIFKGLNTMMIDPDIRLANSMLTTENLMLLLLLACFGDYFKQSILTNQREIEGLAGNELSRDVKWYLRWKVELTARNVFVVHHPLILHVVAALVNSLIFMFQLMLTEDADVLGASRRYNHTSAEEADTQQ